MRKYSILCLISIISSESFEIETIAQHSLHTGTLRKLFFRSGFNACLVKEKTAARLYVHFLVALGVLEFSIKVHRMQKARWTSGKQSGVRNSREPGTKTLFLIPCVEYRTPQCGLLLRIGIGAEWDAAGNILQFISSIYYALVLRLKRMIRFIFRTRSFKIIALNDETV